MALYLCPPGGSTSMSKFRLAVLTRFRFLLDVLKSDGRIEAFEKVLLKDEYASNADLLWENTAYDRISHFALMMLCADDQNLLNLIHEAESALFYFRTTLTTCKEFATSMQYACRHSRKKLESLDEGISKPLRCALREIIRLGHQRLADGVFSGRTSKQLSIDQSMINYAYVHFSVVPSMVAKRKITLSRGIAIIPPIHFDELLSSIFKLAMRENSAKAIRDWKISGGLDERMESLLGEMKNILNEFIHQRDHLGPMLGLQNHLKSSNVDSLTPLFPPCMLNLHLQLRSKHRLHHHARIQYTLFLKSLGMPISEAVQFWKEEYGRPPGDHECEDQRHSPACQHNWSKDGTRYTYNLRHLYGLEGSRRNYSAHCCTALQAKSLSYGDEGGCPFRHFDEASLKDFLRKKMGVFDHQLLDEILHTTYSNDTKRKNVNRCSTACSILLGSKLRHSDTMSQPLPGHKPSNNSSYLSQVRTECCYDHEDCKCDIEDWTDRKIIHRKPQDFVLYLVRGY